ncbi:hypothetical protein NBRC116601_32550 [Cognatishimia sp. WU-CL00825]
MRLALTCWLFLGWAQAAQSDPSVIKDVAATKRGQSWTFSVTLQHADTGWDHYANGWRVLSMQGEVLGTRILTHPHVHEQPFSRSLSGVEIPAGTAKVQIQASCLVDGWSGVPIVVTLNN